MNAATMSEAKREAKRFLAALSALENELARQEEDAAKASFPVYVYAPKFSGAVKRASMDLTRALADLRRPS